VAYALACDAGITVYDALYLALAVREHAPLVTADLQLAAAARRIGLGEHVLSLPDTAAFLASPPPPA
jgi:predicted nucleic acid-binding protein